MKIGWIGAGIMGNPMVHHLLKNGHEAHVYARHPQKVQNLVEEGAVLEESIASLVQHSDVICTMVGFPSDVKEVYGTIFEHIEPGKICIDFTTSSPSLAVALAQQGKDKQVTVLDAPVTGGDAGAKQGTLTILVGGPKETFDQLQPVFSAFGKDIFYCGEAGAGQKVKIANQIMIANTLQGICEAMTYLKSQGCDPALVIQNLQNGAAGSRQLELLGPKMLQNNFDPGFYIKHFVKDLRIALDQKEAKLTGVENVIQEYITLMDQGYQDLGTQALIKYFQ
ncbi:MAG: NAD(P)-dependent oxidoreductase [Erysipelotrichaceae bacterium]|jgi:3-hydroxyisobutyrate dehydrogenase/2-hydroxy-3-oxopropionate reductase|uniref:NAD(P)-dependent oxidoreductase n=1 Tax=Faecalicoccus sp. TaxID=1971758 RepID=UPI002F922361|nr:NAD(P)-dependent oxidoreductase [Erysipelotrichaceae bacterium]